MARGKSIAQRDRAMQLVEQLVTIAPDRDTQDMARALRERLLIPMSAILERMPGDSIAEKARMLQIQRSTFYAWAEGRARPRRGLAEKIAELTGYTWQEVAGCPPDTSWNWSAERAKEPAA